MANQLQPGDALRTLRGTAVIESVEDAGTKNAHGLVIDGYPTYFVGDGQVLVHDKTAPATVDPSTAPLNWTAVQPPPAQPSGDAGATKPVAAR